MEADYLKNKMSYIGDIPEDFDANESLNRNHDSEDNHDEEWDFTERESFDSDLDYKSNYTLNLTKYHAK